MPKKTAPIVESSELIEMIITFDTTGSMYPCLSEVRRKVDTTAKRLFEVIPNLRLGIIAHGDYCDKHIYVTKHLALTSDPNAVSYFVKNVEPTGGGDAPECYELVLRELTQLKWTEGSKRIVVMIGDEVPHPVAHNPGKIDWRDEVSNLLDMGVLIHGVQALNRSHAAHFWRHIAHETGGIHIPLTQFNDATDLLIAVAYQQQGPEALQKFEEELVESRKMTRSLSSIFDALCRRDPKTGRFKKADARAVEPGKFQHLEVLADQAIKALVEENGLVFEKGRGFYEFTKRETIQASKEIVILNVETGDMYQGDAAREVLGLPEGSVRISPDYDREKYKVFVQSTSLNRKLIGGTKFLYEAK